MLHFRYGSVALAATLLNYLIGGVIAAALALVICGLGVHLLSARRRRLDRDAARRVGRRTRPGPVMTEETG